MSFDFNNINIDKEGLLNVTIGLISTGLAHWLGFIDFIAENQKIMQIIMTAITTATAVTVSFFVQKLLKKYFK